jgi:molecular chaperone GrpE
MDEQRKAEKVRAAEKLVTSLLPVIDDLERTIDYADKNGETGITDGVRAVLTKFVDTLKKDGVDIIDPAGEAFDALEAQAVGTVDDASVPDETVAQVYQKGYKLGEKVLRPAMVTVTTGGPKRAEENNK